MSTQVTLDAAEAVIAAARRRADEIGQPMNIAVVDAASAAGAPPTTASTTEDDQ